MTNEQLYLYYNKIQLINNVVHDVLDLSSINCNIYFGLLYMKKNLIEYIYSFLKNKECIYNNEKYIIILIDSKGIITITNNMEGHVKNDLKVLLNEVILL